MKKCVRSIFCAWDTASQSPIMLLDVDLASASAIAALDEGSSAFALTD
jgi:hypothetical protein